MIPNQLLHHTLRCICLCRHSTPLWCMQVVNSTLGTPRWYTQALHSTLGTPPWCMYALNPTLATPPRCTQTLNSTLGTTPWCRQALNSTLGTPLWCMQAVNSTLHGYTTVVVLKAETKIAVEYSLRMFRYFLKIRFIVLVCSKS